MRNRHTSFILVGHAPAVLLRRRLFAGEMVKDSIFFLLRPFPENFVSLASSLSEESREALAFEAARSVVRLLPAAALDSLASCDKILVHVSHSK